MTDKFNRRDFAKATGAAAAVAAGGASFLSSNSALAADTPGSATSDIWNKLYSDIIPGMREQGKGLKFYVESEYAPLKACTVGNTSGVFVPDPDTPENKNLFASGGKEFNAFLRKNKHKNLKDVEPKLFDQMVMESNALADAYRQAGVRVVRFEGDEQPEEITNYTYGWNATKQLSLYGGGSFEVFGNCVTQIIEAACSSATELLIREATNEIMRNSPEAVWLTMPVPTPLQANHPNPGPFTSPGDVRTFPGVVVLGIGVSDPSHIKDPSKPRSSGEEFGAEMMRRMLKPFGWRVETVYFDSRLTYHIDCLMPVLEEGLLAYPKGSLWTELPKEFRDWEVIEMPLEDHHKGCGNIVPLGNKKIVLPRGTKSFARTLEKRGWTCIEVPYDAIYKTFHSGIHCSTGSIWREA